MSNGIDKLEEALKIIVNDEFECYKKGIENLKRQKQKTEETKKIIELSREHKDRLRNLIEELIKKKSKAAMRWTVVGVIVSIIMTFFISYYMVLNQNAEIIESQRKQIAKLKFYKTILYNDSEFAEQKRALERKDSELAEQKKELEWKDSELAKKQRESNRKNSILAQKRRELNRKNSILAEQKKELAWKDSELAEQKKGMRKSRSCNSYVVDVGDYSKPDEEDRNEADRLMQRLKDRNYSTFKEPFQKVMRGVWYRVNVVPPSDCSEQFNFLYGLQREQGLDLQHTKIRKR